MPSVTASRATTKSAQLGSFQTQTHFPSDSLPIKLPTMTTASKLFTPLALGEDLVLKNRVVMAPMMRNRSDRQTRGPSKITELFYEQRAGAGLIIAKATAVSEQAFGWFGAAGCYNKEHVSGWKRVVDRVHAREGIIFLQLWHMGRQGHSSFNSKGELVSTSPIKLLYGTRSNVRGEEASFEVPRALETNEIPAIVEDFCKSAALAKEAGFDGVEIHAGNGYLIDQFMQSVSNKRTDKYGGSFENRARFLLEIVEAIKTVWPSYRIAVRITPNGKYGDMGGEDNFEFFTYVMQQLRPHNLGYLAIPDGEGYTLELHDKCRLVTPFDAKSHFKGVVMACNSYTKDTAERVLRSGAADAVAFGRAYISNPDLAERYKNNWPLASAAPVEVYWSGNLGVEGCTTCPPYATTQDQLIVNTSLSKHDALIDPIRLRPRHKAKELLETTRHDHHLLALLLAELRWTELRTVDAAPCVESV